MAGKRSEQHLFTFCTTWTLYRNCTFEIAGLEVTHVGVSETAERWPLVSVNVPPTTKTGGRVLKSFPIIIDKVNAPGAKTVRGDIWKVRGPLDSLSDSVPFYALYTLGHIDATLVTPKTAGDGIDDKREVIACRALLLSNPSKAIMSREFQGAYSGTMPPPSTPIDARSLAALVQVEYVFVYGTLKRGQPNHLVMTDERNGLGRLFSAGVTHNPWPLIIASDFNVPYLLDAEGSGKNVSGEVYAVNCPMLRFCDVFEDHPRMYLRTLIKITLPKGVTAPGDATSPTQLSGNPDDEGKNNMATNVETNSPTEEGSELDDNRVMWAWAYVFKDFKPELLDAPCYDNYNSHSKVHNRPYVEREARGPYEGYHPKFDTKATLASW